MPVASRVRVSGFFFFFGGGGGGRGCYLRLGFRVEVLGFWGLGFRA